MSELVYLRTSKGPEAQIWHGPPYLGEQMFVTNGLGNFMYPSLGGERLIARIPIKDGEESLGIDKLRELYPLSPTASAKEKC
jgi:hypothetical protein